MTDDSHLPRADTTRWRASARSRAPDAPNPLDAPNAPEPPAPGPRLDARRAHVLDRAAEYVRLHAAGLTAAQIARRRRKSRGHVSILLRLGQALAGVPEDERLALRHPRVTWRLVQGLVRRDTDAASLRRQLRAAVGGFSTHNVDARRRRRARGPTDASGALNAAPAASAPGVAWGWDAAWFARDPAGYAAAHLAHLAHLHQTVAGRAERAVRARGAAALDAGQSLRALQRRLARSGHGPATDAAATPEERRALALLTAVGRALAALRPPDRPQPEPPPADARADAVTESVTDALAAELADA